MRRLALASLLAASVSGSAAADEIGFRRVDQEWGLAFRHHDGASGRYYMVETNGSGGVIFDFDGDGDQDVFLIDGAALPGYRGEAPRSRLFRNDGGLFVDRTAASGIELGPVYGEGGAAGDIDGDGDLDLVVTAFGPDRLFLNGGDGTFTEAGAAAGIADPAWSASAALADTDLDGDLDLYVTRYVDATLENNMPCGDERRRLRGYCGPDVYQPLPDRFYRNRGDGTFDDATAQAGFAAARGAGLALTFADLDDDGFPDLYVANDLTPNFLYRNRGDGTFEDLSLLSGTAYGHRGLAEAGMGVAVGDLDGDATLDVVVTNYEGETHALYSHRGGLVFNDRRFVSGLAEPTLSALAFGVVAADLDHDGDLDLVAANGHVRENAADFDPRSRYRQKNQVFVQIAPGRFREHPASGLDHAAASRGLAAGDLDGDGDLDLIITNVGDQAEVWENVGASGPWLLVELAGGGVGARIELEAGGRRQLRELTAGSSYLSQHALVAHFGLGTAERVERLVVRWPGQGVQVWRGVPASRRLLVGPPP